MYMHFGLLSSVKMKETKIVNDIKVYDIDKLQFSACVRNGRMVELMITYKLIKHLKKIKCLLS